MTPRGTESLVEAVTLSVDAATGLPLAVVVKAAGQATAAFEVSFDSITFATPDSSNFTFKAPAGTKVEEVPLPARADLDKYADQSVTSTDQAKALSAIDKLKSQGWSAVVEIPAAQVPAELKTLKTNKLYTELTKSVAGGRVFTTSLLNVYIADDGRVFAGSVTVQKLLEAAAK
jgi:enterochelin esterase-like enzyme